MADAPIGIVSPNRLLQRQVTRALGAGGFVAAPLSIEDLALKDLALEDLALDRGELAEPAPLLIVDAEQHNGVLDRLFEALPPDAARPRVLALSRTVASSQLARMLTAEGVSNVVARHGGIDGSADLIDERELLVTVRKLVDSDHPPAERIFGLDKYLATWGMRTHRFEIGSVADKEYARACLDDYLEQIDCYRGIANAVGLVAEELMMNALFDAPLDASGRQRYVALERDYPLALEPAERGDLTFGCDGQFLGLAVNDPFGALDRDGIVAYLEHAFRGTRGRLRESSSPGAGRGLLMAFNSSTQLVFNIAAGERTEVIALFYIRGGVRAFRSTGRSLNVFAAR